MNMSQDMDMNMNPDMDMNMNQDMAMNRTQDMNMNMDTGMGDMTMRGDMEMMEMGMHFYSSNTVTILFLEWVTNSTLGYTLSLFAIIAFGIFAVYLKSVKEYLILWQQEKETVATISDVEKGKGLNTVGGAVCAFLDPLKNCITSFSSPVPAFYITCLTFVISVFDFCLMLIAMTFEVGVFLCACLGLSLGYLLFLYPLRLLETRSSKVEATNCCDVL